MVTPAKHTTAEIFEAGARVPDWLLTAEALGPQSIAGQITFAQQVAVIDAGDHYLVAPLQCGAGGAVLVVANFQDHEFYGLTKSVTLLGALCCIGPKAGAA